MKSTMLLMLLGLVISGCASRPVFEDVPATMPALAEVTVVSRVADEATVRSTCAWKSRVAGVKRLEGSPACSFIEDGQRVILWSAPASYNDRLTLEMIGHELLHRHHLIDHK